MKGIKQIKNYRLTSEIGRGATAVVYEAVDDNTHKLYAVKSIPSGKLKNKREMENLKRELKLLHGLNHKNIIKIKGVEKTLNNFYLILEYCNGGNLFEFSYHYRKKYGHPLPENLVQKILKGLIEGLEYMHNNRTVHRDIKLENILLNSNSSRNEVSEGGIPDKLDYNKLNFENEEFTVKIADLGYARELSALGVASTICGTPITMAPDIINLFDGDKAKDQKYNNKVDLWSLGAITFELLVGKPPFYANNYKSLFEDVMAGVYTLPDNLKISVEAITFINGLLQFFPEKRMSFEQIKSHPFITNDPKDLHYVDLHAVKTNFENPQQLQVDTKECHNFVWLNFETDAFKKGEAKITLDKIDESIYDIPILKEIKNEIPNETSDRLDLAKELETESANERPASNRIFDKIFTEMKEELKVSKKSSDKVIEDPVTKDADTIAKENEEINIDNKDKSVDVNESQSKVILIVR